LVLFWQLGLLAPFLEDFLSSPPVVKNCG